MGTLALCGVGCVLGLLFGIPISMVAVGASYDDPTECALPAPHVLKVLGGVGIVFGLLMMCAAPCGEGAMGVVYGISRFVKLILQIWASVLIFGPYNEWRIEGHVEGSKFFCHETPYMFAFVMIIINWVGGLFTP